MHQVDWMLELPLGEGSGATDLLDELGGAVQIVGGDMIGNDSKGTTGEPEQFRRPDIHVTHPTRRVDKEDSEREMIERQREPCR